MHPRMKPGDKGNWFIVQQVRSKKIYGRKTLLVQCNFCRQTDWYCPTHLQRVQSCGCQKSKLQSQALGRHREAGTHSSKKNSTPEYITWQNFRSKINNKLLTGSYPSRWDVYEAWLSEVGRKPSKLHVFGRIDDSQDWTLENVKWMLRSELPNYQHWRKKRDEYLEAELVVHGPQKKIGRLVS